MYRSTFERSLENACAKSYLQSEPFWQSVVVIRNAIINKDVTVEYALDSLRKKMFSENPHTSFYSLCVLESIVIHCGPPVHEQISNALNCEAYLILVNTTGYENVRIKMLELIQLWAFAFRSSHQYRAVEHIMIILRNEGHIFPEMKKFEDKIARIQTDCADTLACQRCMANFSISKRKYNCPNCGRVFCPTCSGKMSVIPKYSIITKIRVCDGCFSDINHGVGEANEDDPNSTDALLEYLSNISLKNSGTHTKKKFQEESDMKLALQISQSDRILLLEKRVQELEEQQRCNICFERKRNVAFLCGHTICSRCADTLNTCHICRKAIARKIYLYN